MKKVLVASVFAFLLLVTGCEKVKTEAADTKLGTSYYAAHGTKSFAVTSVVMDGDKIKHVYIDEFQFQSGDVECVPNGDSTFKTDTACLASKRDNNTAYSNAMKEKGGATKTLVEGYEAIEKYVTDKTVKELESFLDGKDSTEVVDAVSSATLVDTKGYIEAVIEAAKNAK